MIGLEEHKEWFEKKLIDGNCKMFVLQRNSIPLGQVRFDILGKKAEISLSISSEYRGMSYGKRSIRMMSDYILRSGIADRVVAYVKEGNKSSLGAFRSSGYTVLNENIIVKGQKAIELEYSEEGRRTRPIKYLATTSLKQIWEKERDIVLLGPWCFDGETYEGEPSSIALSLAKDIKYTTENLIPNANYCEKVYGELIGEMTAVMNAVHDVQESVDYWAIVLNPWLVFHICMMHEKYTRILKVQNEHKDGLYTHTVEPDENLAPMDTREFLFNKVGDPVYNLQLFSQIIKASGMNHHKAEKFSPLRPETGYSRWGEALNSVKIFVKRMFYKSLSAFLAESDVVMTDMYHIDFWDCVHLSLATGSAICLDTIFPCRRTEIFDYDKELRGKMKMAKGDDPFVNVLKESIIYSMPRCYVEGYAYVSGRVNDIKRKKPHFIISAIGWYFNEMFKFYAARMKSKGSKLVGVQHGGDYGYSLYQSAFIFELKNKDMFFSWGWGKGMDKIKALPNPHLSRIKNTYSNRGDGILYISTNYPKHFFSLLSYPGTEGMEMYFEQQFSFLKKMPSRLTGKLYYRSYPTDYGRRIKDRVKMMNPSIRWADKSRSFQWMRRSRLVVLDHPGTSFVEAMVVNVPLILFYSRELWAMSPYAESLFDAMRSKGIVQPNPDSAAVKLDEVYDNAREWWKDRQIQKIREEFIESYGYSRKNWRDIWAKEIRLLKD